MTLLTQQNHTSIIDAIECLYNQCIQVPGILLTEGDLKCRLFGALSSIPSFSTPVSTLDAHISATSIHAEVPWFDAKGQLTVRPDITILDPEQLSLLYTIGSVKAPPSKQFHFDGTAFIFELKFIRGPRGIANSEMERIWKDFDKINKLFEKLEIDGDANNVFCYFIVFSRYGIACNDWMEFYDSHPNSPHWQLIYKSLNLPIPDYE